MRTVYLPLDEKNTEGKFYQKFEVPDGLPVGNGVIFEGPSPTLKFPKYDNVKGIWVEDKDSIIEYMKVELDKIQEDFKKIKELVLNEKDLDSFNTTTTTTTVVIEDKQK